METVAMQEELEIDVSMQHVSVGQQIQDVYGYPSDKPLAQFFKECPDSSFALCMAMEQKIVAAVAIHKLTIRYIRASIREKDRTAKVLEEIIQEKNHLAMAKDEVIKEKNESIQATKIASEAEKRVLSIMLEKANTETLKLSQSLSVRGMIEKVELQYSEKRRTEGKDATRKAVWVDILSTNEKLKAAMTKHCSGRTMAGRIDAAAEAIVQIYRQASEEIHHAGYDEIPIKISTLHGIQLEVLRGLCAATYYAIREI
jgi:hypothetical protein